MRVVTAGSSIWIVLMKGFGGGAVRTLPPATCPIRVRFAFDPDSTPIGAAIRAN